MSSMNSMRLRELIRSVRKCKTADEERSLINRECAIIKEGFQENTPYVRTRNMLKLLYIRMLGYSAEFGQLEVVNLLAQQDFNGKRIGYLALQLLLDETDEVLMLAENHMKNDMSSRDGLSQAVALNAAANIASEDMCRDVFDDVMRIIEGRATAAVKGKACLAALRIVRKVPEHIEYFLEKFVNIFQENHSSYILCALTLVNYCLQSTEGESFIPMYRKQATATVRALKALVLSSRITEADVTGVTDPFLQVKILEFMRIIGQGSAVTSEVLNDVLAQVITNTDAARNVGSAVLYECVRTINAIESDDGLRLLAVNTISRFLSNSKENNLRVVALQILLDYAENDVETVQQHKDVIIDCLRDNDVSIRRRALELTAALVNEDNVRQMAPDLIQYLTVCSNDMREETTLRICRLIEENAPNDEWRIELSLKVLKLSRQHARVSFAKRLIGVISNQCEEIQASATKFLWEEASFPFDAIHHARKAFMVAALWAIGEYGDLLVSKYKIKPAEICECLSDITNNTTFSLLKQYGLTGMMKMATKYPQFSKQTIVAMSNNLSSLDCELQQRASEYSTLLKNFPEEARFSFARMPPICPAPEEEAKPVQVVSVSPEVLQKQTATALDDLFGFDGPKPDSIATQAAFASGGATLDDIFSAKQSDTPAASAQTTHASQQAAKETKYADPFAPLGEQAHTNAQALPPSKVGKIVYEYSDFSVRLASQLDADVFTSDLIIQNLLQQTMNEITIQIAATKLCVLQVGPQTQTSIAPQQSITQSFTLDTSNDPKNKGVLLLRVKVLYSVAGEAREQLFQVSS